jgi:hypothetical protein
MAAKNRSYKLFIKDLVLSESDTLKIQMLDQYQKEEIEVISYEDFFRQIVY